MPQNLPSSFDGDSDFYEESRAAKLKRRIVEEPLIPIGMLATCWAIIGATRAIRAGNHELTNIMFRRRIYAQGFTIVAMVAGSFYWQSDREERKAKEKAIQERKQKEKTQAWIRELEARHEESEDLKRRSKAVQDAVKDDAAKEGIIAKAVKEATIAAKAVNEATKDTVAKDAAAVKDTATK